MKIKTIIAASVAVLLYATPVLKAQTIDFTGVTISTERVKKTYDSQTMIFATGSYDIDLHKDYNTAQFGVRYAMLWKLGFYAGASIGINGFPMEASRWAGEIYGSSDVRPKRLTFTAGGMVRLGRVVSLYLGSGACLYQVLVSTSDGMRERYSHTGPLVDAGINLGFGPVCALVGATYDFGEYQHVMVNLGVGYRF